LPGVAGGVGGVGGVPLPPPAAAVKPSKRALGEYLIPASAANFAPLSLFQAAPPAAH